MKHHGDFLYKAAQCFTDETAVLDKYDALATSLRDHLAASGYGRAVRAHDFAQRYHKGIRLDGSPEFLHQQAQAFYTLALAEAGLLHRKRIGDVLSLNFTHDLREDFRQAVSYDDVRRETGVKNAKLTERLSKVDANGKKIPQYFNTLALHPVTIMAKMADRINNQATRIGGFDRKKINSYNESTKDLFSRLLTKALLIFPHHAELFKVLGTTLETQCRMYDSWLAGAPLPELPDLPGLDLLPDGLHPLKTLAGRMQKNSPLESLPHVGKPVALGMN